jgi:hypothetical protein
MLKNLVGTRPRKEADPTPQRASIVVRLLFAEHGLIVIHPLFVKHGLIDD